MFTWTLEELNHLDSICEMFQNREDTLSQWKQLSFWQSILLAQQKSGNFSAMDHAQEQLDKIVNLWDETIRASVAGETL